MKKTIFSATFLLALSCLSMKAQALTGDDLISQVKLQQNMLPKEIQIVKEVKASPEQIGRVRTRVGFPVIALVNQVFSYQNEQAQVNYLAVQNESWLSFGYTTLSQLDSKRSLIFAKNLVILQVAATSASFQNRIAELLGADPLHLLKIRVNDLPSNWGIMKDELVLSGGLQELQNDLGTPIQASLSQELSAGHINMELDYYRCKSALSASEVAQRVVNQKKPLYKMIIGICGPTIVVAQSQDQEMNEKAMSLVEWPKDCQVQTFPIHYTE